MNEAAALFEERGEVWWQAWALNFLGAALVEDAKDTQRSLKVIEKEAMLWEKTGDQCASTGVLWDLCALAFERGEVLEAYGYLKESLQRCRKAGAKSNLLQTLVHLGDIARALKQYDQAESYYKESMPLVYATFYYPWLPRIYQGLGYTMLGKGNLQQAEGYFQDALRESQELHFKHGRVHFIAGYAALAVARGRMQLAVRLFGVFLDQPERLRSDMKIDKRILILVDEFEIKGYLNYCKSQMEKAEFEEAWSQGSSLSLNEALDEILKVK